MNEKKKHSSKLTTVKVCVIAAVCLFMFIPLLLIQGLIIDRESNKNAVCNEVANSVAKAQTIEGPMLVYQFEITDPAVYTINEKTGKSELTQEAKVLYEYKILCPQQLNYKVNVETELRSRSIYNVLVYKSVVDITGNFSVPASVVGSEELYLKLELTDLKGLSETPRITFAGKTYSFKAVNGELQASIKLPAELKGGEVIDFKMQIPVKGTEELFFVPIAEETTLAMESAYPHPSFQGNFLPQTHNISEAGFNAEWKVLRINTSGYYDKMGVRFVEPANPYQQSARSVKYGILIILLVFVAGLLVEFLTRKEIKSVQYAVIALSLVLFYSLLLSFSEFISFGVSYLVAALMTLTSLLFYFRGILKNKSAYLLALFVALVSIVNYMLLQMETYALLTGSLVLFVLLSVVMYLTANMNRSNVPSENVESSSEKTESLSETKSEE